MNNIFFIIFLLSSTLSYGLSDTDDLVERYGEMTEFNEEYEGMANIAELLDQVGGSVYTDDLVDVEDERINSITARIESTRADGRIIYCSGVLIGRDKVLSAAHCVEQGAKIKVIIGKGREAEFIGVESIVSMNMPKRLLGLPKGYLTIYDVYNYTPTDVVIFNLSKESKFKPLDILPLEEDDILSKNLIIAGFPGRGRELREQTSFEGVSVAKNVSSSGYCYFLDYFEMQYDGVLLTNCVSTPGNSGGPLFTYVDGVLHLVGIASMTEWIEVKENKERVFGESYTGSYFVNIHRPEVKRWIDFNTRENK